MRNKLVVTLVFVNGLVLGPLMARYFIHPTPSRAARQPGTQPKRTAATLPDSDSNDQTSPELSPTALNSVPSPAAPKTSTKGAANSEDTFTMAHTYFLRLDRNGDGFLSYEELPEDLRLERDKWDENGDGQIDLTEWCQFVLAHNSVASAAAEDDGRLPTNIPDREPTPIQPPTRGERGGLRRLPGGAWQGRGGVIPIERLGAGGGGGGGVTLPNLDGPAAPSPEESAAHISKQPDLLPRWFVHADTDGDGQVSLSEWKDRGGDIFDFRKLDINGDGLVTVEELIRTGKLVVTRTDFARPVLNPEVASPDSKPIIADPGDMTKYRGQNNKSFMILVKGEDSGDVWGTDHYTDESSLATAAVHMGIVQVGQKVLLKVRVLKGEPYYIGSQRHGVTSQFFANARGSFRIEGARPW